jgi:hypothetical protein
VNFKKPQNLIQILIIVMNKLIQMKNSEVPAELLN